MKSLGVFDLEVILPDAEIVKVKLSGYKSFQLEFQFKRRDFRPKQLGEIFRLFAKMADNGFKEEAVDAHNAEIKKDIQ